MNDKVSNSPSMAFIMNYLQKNGDTEYATVRREAEKDGHTIYPIMYGRAKALLGMITESPRRRRREATPAAEGGEGTSAYGTRAILRQGTQRTSSLGESTAAQLGEFLARFKEVEAERNRYRSALQQVEKYLRLALESDVAS